MQIYLKEKIGDPNLFTGRNKEIEILLKWIDRIKLQRSKSTAILSRRKTGKSALMQRLYNMVFHLNDGVIPFYFEIKEQDKWYVDFSMRFFMDFINQYIAFKTRKPEYLTGYAAKSCDQAIDIARKENLDYLIKSISDIKMMRKENRYDDLWDEVRDLPRFLCHSRNERVVQMIDEFQYLNWHIFWDEKRTHRADEFAGTYLHTCEYKTAPLLVSGSWVGWLINDLNRLLPGRFNKIPMKSMPKDETIKMIFNYSRLEKIPVTEETAYLIAKLTEGSPFYISCLFGSNYEYKDLSTKDGLLKTLEFETLDFDGSINATWMEYIDATFSKVNDVHAKEMVLYLSKNRDRKIGHSEIKKALGLDMPDPELNKKLKALYRSDVIEEHMGFYCGVRDNIFDKVFRRSYSDDIEKFLTKEAPEEYKAMFDKLEKKYNSLQGKFNRYKGAYAEFMICNHLSEAYEKNDFYKTMLNNVPDDFNFVEYSSISSITSPPLNKIEFQIDIFAKASDEDYTIIGEVKNREKKFSLDEAQNFITKANELIRLEKIKKYVFFVFSSGGFMENVFEFLEDSGIIWTDDKMWISNCL